MRSNLTVITLGVKDFKKSLRFYKDGLGWKPAQVMDDVAFFPLSGIVLAIYPRDLLAKDAAVKNDGKGFDGMTLAYNTKSEKEADDVLKQVKKIGGKIVKKAHKTFWGGYGGYFADPDGHLWEVVHNPHWKLDKKGRVVISKK